MLTIENPITGEKPQVENVDFHQEMNWDGETLTIHAL